VFKFVKATNRLAIESHGGAILSFTVIFTVLFKNKNIKNNKMHRKYINDKDPFQNCTSSKDLWYVKDQVKKTFNQITPYLIGVKTMAKLLGETAEFRIGGESLVGKEVRGRYLSRNDPSSGKLITIDDYSNEDGFLDKPHAAFAIQESDIIDIVNKRKFLQRMFYLPLLTYLRKIEPVQGYDGVITQAKSIANELIFPKK
jgi:hypothetical protein